ncbi:MAG: glycosyltransferase [Actinomycetota bacterium]|nr:glycosyltransferase [Actinomycetota bacterium]
MELFLFYQYAVLLILSLLLVNYIANHILFRKTGKPYSPEQKSTDLPLISILVPARNEEEHIRICLNSLLKQDYPAFEIIVLDDNSTDKTYDIAESLSKKDARLRVIKGKKLKSGWLGKSFACHQLSQQARGKILVFTDSDTLHFPHSVSSAVNSLISGNYGGISVFPQQIMVTIHERMMVPFGNFMILCFLPLLLVKKSKNPLFCTAIGQYMLFRKEVYQQFGGHKTIRKEILEDIHIAKLVKKTGHRFMIFDGTSNVYCRMYKNLDQVIKGYTKVLFAAFDYNFPNFLLAVIMITVLFLAPFVFLPLTLIFNWPQLFTNIIAAQILIIFLMKIIYAVRFKTRGRDILLHPLSVAYLLLIAINSFCKCRFGAGLYWKDRVYDVTDEQDLKLIKHPK